MKVKKIDIPIEKIANLCQNWHIHKLSLFGSFLRDDFTPESDIDILVEFEPGFTPGFFKLYQIEEELSDLFDRRQIDLVTLKFLNHRIRDRILAEAEVFYIKSA
ncbi:nucleotidyltransferase family protein [Roseofilum capinflatum]|uniref:Nucleotidyltransferase family protein n=1 Tax=Roseofilum capinflatum BLCC-M114 TaxID=3022440 RepID=A0ABT7B6M4_9CYAN|nr:nucleotidyltransferase family protein [Roseofilum capinflatum]MDJ1174808.1 nucleotidyltransferase family protein [Roseofilum capinflatum BLCC-M114]